ncbi:hypothetical protein EK904_011994 [Melospiza melodia maxima]|nr:hypothetical protein EK904_011994 [Melospiza melodia maxima]
MDQEYAEVPARKEPLCLKLRSLLTGACSYTAVTNPDSPFREAEKFGDSFVFEGMLSEAVKADIHQAVSSTAGGSSLSNPWALVAITAGKTELCGVPKARCKNGDYGENN